MFSAFIRSSPYTDPKEATKNVSAGRHRSQEKNCWVGVGRMPKKMQKNGWVGMDRKKSMPTHRPKKKNTVYDAARW